MVEGLPVELFLDEAPASAHFLMQVIKSAKFPFFPMALID